MLLGPPTIPSLLSDEDGLVGSYDTPQPELDDYRQLAFVSSGPRQGRRLTSDSVFATAQPQGTDPVSVFSHETVVVEDDADPVSAGRAVSPPNSVKAFSQARRRERGLSASSVQNTDVVSVNSAAAHQPQASIDRFVVDVAQDSSRIETRSLKSNPMVEKEICFAPSRKSARSDGIRIDFSALEALIAADEKADEASKLEPSSTVQVFSSLVQRGEQQVMVTTNGDFLFSPPATASTANLAVAVKDISPNTPAIVGHKLPVDPNRFTFFSSAWESNAYARSFGGLLLDEDVRRLFTFPREDSNGVWWLNVVHPTEDEIRMLCKAFLVHPLTIEDIFTQEAREKIELFHDYYFVSFKSFRRVNTGVELEYVPFNVYVVVFHEGTLSFSFHPNNHAANVRKRISRLNDYVSLSSDWICYALIDNIVDSFAPEIEELERRIDQIEDSVFVSRPADTSDFLQMINVARKQSMSFNRLLIGKADVLRGFTKRCNTDYRITPRLDIALYLGDVQDHVVTMHNNIIQFDKILSRTYGNYIGHLTIESISSGNKINNTFKRISFAGALFLPLNLVCSMFGMNVAIPFGEGKSLMPFSVIFACLMVLSLVCSYVARRQKWL